MLKNKKIMILILSFIAIITIIFGTSFLFKNNNQDNNPNNNNDNSISKGNSIKELPLEIKNFSIDKKIDNELGIIFEVINNNRRKTSSKTLYLNFYNGNDLLYTHEFSIKQLRSNELITIEGVISFTYDEITKYEFELDGIKKELEPIYVS